MVLHSPEGTPRLELQAETDATNAYVPYKLRWTDETGAPMWDLDRRTTNTLTLRNHATGTNTLWVDDTDTLHVHDLTIEGASSVDAGTLDGLDSTQFVRSDVADTTSCDLDVGGVLSEAGSPVLTQADEGALDAGTLEGATLTQTRPTAEDDGTTIMGGPSAIDYGQYLQVTDDGDGTITVDGLGGNAVGSTASASGDGSTTTFTVTHELGTTPATVDVTPTSPDAGGDYHVTTVTSTSLDIVYATAPPAGTSNLSWHVTAMGNDGSGKHTVAVQDDGVQVDLADTLNFAGGLDVTSPSAGVVDLSSPPGVSAEDDGTAVVTDTAAINFASNLTVTDDLDGTVTVDGSDTYPSVSNGGTQVLGAPTDINAGTRLTAVDDGDGTTTLNVSGDADTVDGLHGSQFLRSDVADTHSGTLSLTTLAAAGTAVGVRSPLAPTAGTPLQHESGATYHYLRIRRDGVQTLTGGANAPTDYATTIEPDATLAFVEADNDVVTGWVNTNAESLTMGGGVRVGDKGGDAQAALDVRGSADFHANEAKGFRLENRTSDPASPAPGQMWIRTDLV